MRSSIASIALGTVVALASPAAAFWRMPCNGPVVVERADPVVDPGKVSGHVHTVMGGNGFDFTMNFDTARASTCSTCMISKDLSNYWVPTLYYKAKNGSFISVEQNGATIYYEQRAGNNEDLSGQGGHLLAFPPGFRMVAGDPMKRSASNDLAGNAISFACLYGGGQTNGFPTRNCANGLRAQVYFPSCWDGVNLDSPDHKSHVSYPAGQNFDSGPCPASHPKHLISIFYEVTWNINAFANEFYEPFPFVLSSGDPTGYGWHGDFVNGWDVDFLQQAIVQCTANSGSISDCPLLNSNTFSGSEMSNCAIAPKVNEKVFGELPQLPGCNPIQAGPAEAVKQTNCASNATIGPAATYFKDVTQSKGWAYQGCATDVYNSRSLTAASTNQADMTVENCIDFCSKQGYSLAGMEYSTECYCANSIDPSRAPNPTILGTCRMPCGGDKTEYCGDAGALSLYKKCTGTCTNAVSGVTGGSGGSGGSGTLSEGAPAPSGPAGGSPGGSSGGAPSGSSGGTPSGSSGSHPSGSSGGSQGGSQSGSPSASSTKPSSTAPKPTSSKAVSVADFSTSTTTPSTTSVTTSASPSQSTTTSTGNSTTGFPSGWKASGCYVDTLNPRTFPNFVTVGGSMTNEACVTECDKRKYTAAGTENGGQCFCSQSLTGTKAPDGDCNMKCHGDSSETCGGPARLTTFSTHASSRRSMRIRHAMHRRSSH